MIFVKLWQFDPEDRQQVRTMIERSKAGSRDGGIRSQILFEDDRERVEGVFLDAGGRLERELPGGGELLVLSGGGSEHDDTLAVHSWLRSQAGSMLDFRAGAEGAVLWLKSGHLLHAEETIPEAT